MNAMCKQCPKECAGSFEEPCRAVEVLLELYREQRIRGKVDIVKELRPLLNITDYETAEDLKALGEAVIEAMPELDTINAFDIKIGYVRSFEVKRDKGKAVYADCRKVTGTYSAYLPFDFIVTFYDPNISPLSENQIKILMLHELKHIGVGSKGFKIEPHDVEDFETLLSRYGMKWNALGEDVPDIFEAHMVQKIKHSAGDDNGHKVKKQRNKR